MIRKFRIKWPWEQDRQMAVYNRTPEHIQIVPDPDKSEMILSNNHKKGDGWCLSHLPGNGCFISHFCADQKSKDVITRKYTVPPSSSAVVPVKAEFSLFSSFSLNKEKR